jgi:hypothetical protein
MACVLLRVVAQDYFPFSQVPPPSIEGTHAGELLSDATGTAAWVVVATFLYHKEFFLKI